MVVFHFLNLIFFSYFRELLVWACKSEMGICSNFRFSKCLRHCCLSSLISISVPGLLQSETERQETRRWRHRQSLSRLLEICQGKCRHFKESDLFIGVEKNSLLTYLNQVVVLLSVLVTRVRFKGDSVSKETTGESSNFDRHYSIATTVRRRGGGRVSIRTLTEALLNTSGRFNLKREEIDCEIALRLLKN